MSGNKSHLEDQIREIPQRRMKVKSISNSLFIHLTVYATALRIPDIMNSVRRGWGEGTHKPSTTKQKKWRLLAQISVHRWLPRELHEGQVCLKFWSDQQNTSVCCSGSGAGQVAPTWPPLAEVESWGGVLGVLLSLRAKEVDYVRSALARSKQKVWQELRNLWEMYASKQACTHTHARTRTHGNTQKNKHTLWQRTACQNAKETTLWALHKFTLKEFWLGNGLYEKHCHKIRYTLTHTHMHTHFTNTVSKPLIYNGIHDKRNEEKKETQQHWH